MSDSQTQFAQPLEPHELDRLTDGELATFVRFSGFQWLRFRRLSRNRWRWRRADRRAARAFGERVRRDAGPPPALCQRCAEHPATTHWAYGEGASLRFGHFCKACARQERPGWFVVSAPEPKSSSRPAS